MRFLFQILFRAKTLIKLCYVKIGLLVTGIGLLSFWNKPIEGQAKCERGKGGEQEIGRAKLHYGQSKRSFVAVNAAEIPPIIKRTHFIFFAVLSLLCFGGLILIELIESDS